MLTCINNLFEKANTLEKLRLIKDKLSEQSVQVHLSSCLLCSHEKMKKKQKAECSMKGKRYDGTFDKQK